MLLAITAGILVFVLVPKRTVRNLYLYTRFRVEERKPEPLLAIFDWNSKELKVSSVPMQYFDFRITGSGSQFPAKLEGLNLKKPVFLTVEMWSLSLSGNPLDAMLKGKYDQHIKSMCRLFSGTQQRVYIRWNPEMEVPAHLYPWQGQSPILYNAAFKHFSTLCKDFLPNVKIIWSTAGYPGVLEYYPGDEVVDYVSVSLQSASEKSTGAFPEYQSISDEISRKVHRMRFLQKPVFILGQAKQVKSDSVHQGIISASKYIHANQVMIYPAGKRTDNNILVGNNINESFKIGVYDPNVRLNELPEVSTEHLFPNWKDLQNGAFKKQFDAVIARGHHVIVTMEPWKEIGAKPDTNLLLSLIKGRYDEHLRSLYKIISNTEQTVYLRWMHEMEIPVTRYPWQSQAPVNYIRAFRYFASFRQQEDANIKLVWGPAGDRGLQDWYPGDDVVDYISMAIYGLPDKNITDYKRQESFQTIFNRKIYRLRFFDKPIFITEVGIKGPESFQREWLKAAAKTIVSNPQVHGVSYFNMVDSPKAWGNIEAPDWSISEETFRSFAKSLNLNQSNSLVSK